MCFCSYSHSGSCCWILNRVCSPISGYLSPRSVQPGRGRASNISSVPAPTTHFPLPILPQYQVRSLMIVYFWVGCVLVFPSLFELMTRAHTFNPQHFTNRMANEFVFDSQVWTTLLLANLMQLPSATDLPLGSMHLCSCREQWSQLNRMISNIPNQCDTLDGEEGKWL